MGYGRQCPYVTYFQHLQGQLNEQTKRIESLESSLESIRAEVKTWKEQKRIHIDKIEYKFDQLKVEKLDGTLNIGLTPGAIDELAVNDQSNPAENDSNGTDDDVDESQGSPSLPFAPGMQEGLGRELYNYVEEQVPKQVDTLLKQHGLRLDDWHQKMITEDLKRQVNARIHYYLQQMGQGATVDQLSSIRDSVLFRTKNDIRTAITNYFNKIPIKDGEAK